MDGFKWRRNFIVAGLMVFFAFSIWTQVGWAQIKNSSKPIYDIQGVVMTVAPSGKSLVVSEKEIQVTKETVILNGQNQIPLANIKKGMYVGVLGQKIPQGGFIAQQIDILPSPLQQKR